MSEINPCPRCGGQAEVAGDWHEEWRFGSGHSAVERIVPVWRVECTTRNCLTFGRWMRSKGWAIRAWNRRAER